MAKAFLVNIFATTTTSGVLPFQAIRFCRPVTAYISGTVKDYNGVPLEREVRLYRYEDYVFDSTVARSPYAVTRSDSSTGAFSFTVKESSKMRWTVTCIGANGENVLSFHHVRVAD